MNYRIKISLLVFYAIFVTANCQDNDIYKVERVNISSRIYNEMSPVLYDGGLLFCSDRKISGFKDVRTYDRQLLYNIYFAALKDSLEWNRPRAFSGSLSALANEGPFCFTSDGLSLYYSSNVRQGKDALKQGIKNCVGIYIADRQGEQWTNIRPFKYNDPLWNVAHPFISKDGKYLFFASDLPGGQGGSDIWMCEKLGGEWTEPVNLGPEVNSPGADLYPWFSPGGELIFASDREGGFGGLDLYSSKLRFGTWKEAKIFPEPINSAYDDFSYIAEESATRGFFSSNRNKTDDIYSFESLIKRNSDCNMLVIDQFCYEFTEENAQKFDSMPYEYEWDFDDGNKALGVTAEHCFTEPGRYIVKLNVIDKVTNDIQYEEVSYILDIVRTEQAYIHSPDTCFTNDVVTFDAAMTNLPGWEIGEYYWNFDDGTIAIGEQVSKAFSSPGLYVVQLIVSAVPDKEGNRREECVSKIVVVNERN